MSVAPFAGVVALDNFKSPTVAVDGIQGQVPKPLAGQNGYVLTADGWVPIGTAGAVTSVGTAGTVNGITLTGGPITTSGTITLGGTLDLSSPPAIGGTTPAAGTFTTLIGGKDAANYGQLTGGATTKAVQFQTLGTDTNISMALQPKGTGAIDLAAGSSGVNISNGGTVTAITRTNGGSGYTSFPTPAITAPTTAGGVQAVISVSSMATTSAAINSGGTGYIVGDVLTVVGGTGGPTTLTVSTVSSGVITATTITTNPAYTALPTNPVSVTGGAGTSATFNIVYGVSSSGLIVTTAGSGYVEQPTVTFSGGGGSGAAAYATVGGTAKITGIGPQTDFYTPSGAILSTLDGGLPATGAYLQLTNSSASNSINRVIGSGGNLGLYWLTKGTSPHAFATNNSSGTVQFQVAHTASAVNYVQVTGGATGSPGVVTMSAQGSSTDVDIAITPKGAGVVKFATYTAGIIAQAGYITIKDSGGTVRRLLVG
jgi:hypothetical protein